jgi:hypothetical protein
MWTYAQQRSQLLALYGDKAYRMPIPHAERAVVDIRKLRDYCLNPMHDEGQHKARLFATALGMTADDAEDLRTLLLQAVNITDGQLGRRDVYGQRYTVDFLLEWRDKQAMVRSGWIIEHDSDTPRLTTCYPL